MAQKQVRSDFEEARMWTEKQAKAGKLDITNLQQDLVNLGVLTQQFTSGKFDRPTYDAVKRLQAQYDAYVDKLKSKDFKKIAVDGKCGDQTEKAMTRYLDLEQLVQAQEKLAAKPQRVAEGYTEMRRVKKDRIAAPVKREPEQLTEEAALARVERILETGWEKALVTRGNIGTWDYSPRGYEPTNKYEIALAMPDGKVVEFTLYSNATLLTRSQLKTLALRALEGYGETGALRKPKDEGGGKYTLEGKAEYALITNVSLIQGTQDSVLYSYKGGATDDLKRREFDSGESYLVHLARQLRGYDRS